MQENEEFGTLLKRLISERYFTLTELSDKTGVHLPNLSKIASGKRQCGLAMAVRLADALELWGSQRLIFMQAASSTTKKPTASEVVDYPPELRDLVLQALSMDGIRPEDIQEIEGHDANGWPIVQVRDSLRIKIRVEIRPL